jgi:hypothetical protein
MSQASKGDESKSADQEMFDHMMEEAFERGTGWPRLATGLWTEH